MTIPFLSSVSIIIILTLTIQTASAQQITELKNFWRIRFYQNDEKIHIIKLESILSENPDALPYYRKSKSKQTLRDIASLVDSGFAGWLAVVRNKHRDTFNGRDFRVIGPWLGGIVATVVVWEFGRSSAKYRTMAIEAYNGSVDSDDNSYFEIMSSVNGVGIRYVF